MKLAVLNNIVKTMKPGVYSNISYLVECPVKAASQKEGVRIRKQVSMTARFGINYYNITAVKNKKSNSEVKEKSKPSNFIPLVKNYLYFNSNTGNVYLNVYPIKNNHKKVEYLLSEDFGNKWTNALDDDTEFICKNLRESYLTKKPTEMLRINVDNIISVNGRED